MSTFLGELGGLTPKTPAQFTASAWFFLLKFYSEDGRVMVPHSHRAAHVIFAICTCVMCAIN